MFAWRGKEEKRGSSPRHAIIWSKSRKKEGEKERKAPLSLSAAISRKREKDIMGRPPPLSSFFSPPVFVLRFLPLFSWETAGRSTWGGFMRKIGSGIAYKDFPGPLLPGFFPFFCGLLLIPGVTNISALHATTVCIQYQNCQIFISYAKRTLAMLFKTNLFWYILED